MVRQQLEWDTNKKAKKAKQKTRIKINRNKARKLKEK